MIQWFNKKMSKKRKGFTLIELIVVIAILGILAAIAVPRFTKQTANAKLVADQATARNIVGALNIAIADGKAEIDGTSIKFNKVAKTDQEIITALKELDLLDDVSQPQSSGAKFVVSIATKTDESNNVTKGGIVVNNDTNPPVQFYPVKNK